MSNKKEESVSSMYADYIRQTQGSMPPMSDAANAFLDSGIMTDIFSGISNISGRRYAMMMQVCGIVNAVDSLQSLLLICNSKYGVDAILHVTNRYAQFANISISITRTDDGVLINSKRDL